MSNWDVIHSSKRHEWQTPPELMTWVKQWADIELDVAASPNNAQAERYFTVDDDGLTQDWTTKGTDEVGKPTWAWCNPPYGRNIGSWFEKAHFEYEQGVRTAILAFASTDTKWFRFAFIHCTSILFLCGRVRFLDPDTGERRNAAPKGSALYLFDPYDEHYKKRRIEKPYDQPKPSIELFTKWTWGDADYAPDKPSYKEWHNTIGPDWPDD